MAPIAVFALHAPGAYLSAHSSPPPPSACTQFWFVDSGLAQRLTLVVVFGIAAGDVLKDIFQYVVRLLCWCCCPNSCVGSIFLYKY